MHPVVDRVSMWSRGTLTGPRRFCRNTSATFDATETSSGGEFPQPGRKKQRLCTHSLDSIRLMTLKGQLNMLWSYTMGLWDLNSEGQRVSLLLSSSAALKKSGIDYWNQISLSFFWGGNTTAQRLLIKTQTFTVVKVKEPILSAAATVVKTFSCSCLVFAVYPSPGCCHVLLFPHLSPLQPWFEK